jgi:hypothetical protein
MRRELGTTPSREESQGREPSGGGAHLQRARARRAVRGANLACRWARSPSDSRGASSLARCRDTSSCAAWALAIRRVRAAGSYAKAAASSIVCPTCTSVSKKVRRVFAIVAAKDSRALAWAESAFSLGNSAAGSAAASVRCSGIPIWFETGSRTSSREVGRASSRRTLHQLCLGARHPIRRRGEVAGPVQQSMLAPPGMSEDLVGIPKASRPTR